MKKIFLLFLTIIGATLFSGCQSDAYYADKAVQKARKSALDSLRFLTPNQRSYIRFNKPVLLYDPIFAAAGAGSADLAQTCIVWHVPGIKKSVVAFGLGRFDMRGWYPKQIFLKTFKPADILRETAIKKAVLYVNNNMLFLNNAELNRVRFSPPQIVITDFKVSNTLKQLEQSSCATKPIDKLVKGKNQVSLVWKSAQKGEKIVVTGLCDKYFKNWTAVEGLLRSQKELFEYTLKYNVTGKDVSK